MVPEPFWGVNDVGRDLKSAAPCVFHRMVVKNIPSEFILSEAISYQRPLADAAVSYPGSMTAATSWCNRDRQDRHPSPVDSLHASDSVGLPACPRQMVESGRSLSDSEPSCGIRNDPSPVILRSGLAGDRQRFFQSTMAFPMVLVEYTPEAVLV